MFDAAKYVTAVQIQLAKEVLKIKWSLQKLWSCNCSVPLFMLSINEFWNRKELTADARELKGELYCLPCHDKVGVPTCGAWRRPIEGRVVNAMGKQWHVEVNVSWHIVFHQCKPKRS